MLHRPMRIIAGVAIIGLTLAATPAAQRVARAQTYSVLDLGASTPAAINRSGQVTGSRVFSAGQPAHAFLWNPSSPNTFIDVGLPKGYTSSVGSGLNNRGDVAGSGSGAPSIVDHALLWPAGGAAQFIGPTTKSTRSVANGVNDSQDVVGNLYGTGGGAFLSKIVSGTRQRFIIGNGSGYPNAINTAGQILVNTSTFDYPSGYLWTPSGAPGQGTSINLPSGYTAYALADTGALAGTRIDLPVHPYALPVAYSPLAGAWLDVPWPPAIPQGTWDWGRATGINNSEVVVGVASASDPNGYEVGNTGWIWDSANGTRDLNALIPSGTGWVLFDMNGRAPTINDSGWIIGTGLLNGVRHGFVLIPN